MSNPVIMKNIPTNQQEMKETSNIDMISLMTWSLGQSYYRSRLLERNKQWKCNIPEATIRSTASGFMQTTKNPDGHLKTLDKKSRIGVVTTKPWYRWAGKSPELKGEIDTAKQVMRDLCENHDNDYVKEFIMTMTRVIMATVHDKKISRKTLNGYWRELIDGGFIIKVDPNIFEDDEIQSIVQDTQPLKEDLDTTKKPDYTKDEEYMIFGRPFTKEEMDLLPDNPTLQDLFYHVVQGIPIDGKLENQVNRKLIRGIFRTYSNDLKKLEELDANNKNLTAKNNEQISQITRLIQRQIELETQIDELTKESLSSATFDLKGQLKQYGSVLRG